MITSSSNSKFLSLALGYVMIYVFDIQIQSYYLVVSDDAAVEPREEKLQLCFNAFAERYYKA